MSLSRALLIALVGSSLWLQVELAGLQYHHSYLHHAELRARAPSRAPTPNVAVVDVSPEVEALASVVRVIDGERVIAVGGQRVHDEAGALAALATTWRGSGRYADLEIETIASGATRRVIVLMH